MNEIDPKQLNRLINLLGAIRDGVITQDEFAELRDMLDSSSQARELYLDYIELCSSLSDLHSSLQSYQYMANECDKGNEYPNLLNKPITMSMLLDWAEYEKQAETVEVCRSTDDACYNYTQQQTKPAGHRVSKFWLTTLVTSMAALVFLIAMVTLSPKGNPEVATLTKTFNAVWESKSPIDKGCRLTVLPKNKMKLVKGVVEIQSDKGVDFTIEAPANFCFISPDEVVMDYGRLYATVPESGSGFSVKTTNSKIIDLGTKFGVYANMTGETQLHVYKGKTTLIAGSKGEKETYDVAGGQAGKVNSTDGNFSRINLNNNLFVQRIDEEANMLITGGREVNLADIVGGGDGLGSGFDEHGLSWDGTGYVPVSSEKIYNIDYPNTFVPVSCNRLIDGIFVPHGNGNIPQVLSSEKETLDMDEFIASDTNGLITLMIVREFSDDNAAYWFSSKEAAEGVEEKIPTLVFPNADNGAGAKVTTAYNKGADTYVSNDQLRSPNQCLGQFRILSCRYFQASRVKIMYLRFDVSDVQGDLSDAILNMFLYYGNRSRDLQVYGLKDEAADMWDENAICYNTAPGLKEADYGEFEIDTEQVEKLGNFNVINNRIKISPIQIDSESYTKWSPPSTLKKSSGVIFNSCKCPDDKNSNRKSRPGNNKMQQSIYIHANAGVTFDLDAVRNEFGGIAIDSFKALCGVCGSSFSASFYILVDGKEVFNATDVSAIDNYTEINIPINSTNRYLTLVATQGEDNSISNDECVFVNPRLQLR